MPPPSIPTPSPAVVRSPAWLAAVAAVLAGVGFAFLPILRFLAREWSTKADYSHGWLVVPFAGYLLWLRKDRFQETVSWPNPLGVVPVLTAVVIYFVAEKTNVAKEWAQGFAVVLALAGVVVGFCGGWAGLRWAWPGLAYLLFALPLPYSAEQLVSLKLRAVATAGGTATFQTLGLPAYADGNIITIGGTKLEVAEACSGLSMVLTFVAVAAAAALLMRSRPAADRLLVFASALPIAALCNGARIVLTGLVYHAGWKELGDLIVHDLFGWLMMPLALGLIWVELRVIDWVFVPARDVTRDEVLRTQFRSGVVGTPPLRTGFPPPGPGR
ncbi:MAG: exosortase/archaeosortase family protein [Fimbriiglobus sp.]